MPKAERYQEGLNPSEPAIASPRSAVEIPASAIRTSFHRWRDDDNTNIVYRQSLHLHPIRSQPKKQGPKRP
ncbi:uncharacterized protein BO66DRAFT_394440 [Aspergillus aculeatinus CBS 121060]|uniref:Uncharacterized protein n=1 Tax=Aspergillus aculeatinus CBS 121060 TaxID=1448322 RepID=A0ACD1GZI8_9EURO|nr:hypothetical protein BO66DRAFT_394440 [Aspergillus aculeatinus CBS 121060]RAH66713.1 hypothetical protein BO66DRAFT_394440 [Aspergillus aculeatinus CBS 121060]